jgi:hypothetical protein
VERVAIFGLKNKAVKHNMVSEMPQFDVRIETFSFSISTM